MSLTFCKKSCLTYKNVAKNSFIENATVCKDNTCDCEQRLRNLLRVSERNKSLSTFT